MKCKKRRLSLRYKLYFICKFIGDFEITLFFKENIEIDQFFIKFFNFEYIKYYIVFNIFKLRIFITQFWINKKNANKKAVKDESLYSK